VVAFGVPADTVKSKFWPVEIQPGFLSHSAQLELSPVSHVTHTKPFSLAVITESQRYRVS
jgi:hypothetical protein